MSHSESVGGYGHRQQNRNNPTSGRYLMDDDSHRSASSWRSALLGGAAASALLLGMGAPAFADPATPCTTSGTTETCSGDLAGGIDIGENDGIDQLIVTSPSANIAPPAGISGIRFISNGAVEITSDTGSNAISVTGERASGIKAQSYEDGDIGDIKINHTGAITATDGFGVWAETDGAIDLTTHGAISAGLDAIKLHGTGDGTIDIDVTSNLTSTLGSGIVADTNGGITETSVGTIDAAIDGINLRSNVSGDVSIDHDGAINATAGNGITGWGQGEVTSQSEGNIQAGVDAIRLESHGSEGLVDVHHTGDLTADAGYGVYTEALGTISIDVNGAIDAGHTGIYARTSDSESLIITHTGGSIIAHDADGIVALGPNAVVSVTNTGTIESHGVGIYAESGSQSVTVSQTGALQSSDGKGIYAYSGDGAVEITKTGTVTAKSDAVTAVSGSKSTKIVQTGDITSTAGNGVVMSTLDSTADLTGSGAIKAASDAITISANQGVTVNRTAGAIESTGGTGIKVVSDGAGVSVTNNGTITANQDGIRSESTTDNTIFQTGDVTASNGAAIWASSTTGTVSVTSSGAIQGKTYGIYAKNSDYGSVTVNQTGTVTSTAGKGIEASSPSGDVTVTTGAVSAALDGIDASNLGYGKVEITSAGVTSTHGVGIKASSSNGIVKITNTGAIVAELTGIKASNTDNVAVTVVQNGTVTSTSGKGIEASSSTGAVNVTTGAITSALDGIDATNFGGGTIDIISAGVVSTAGVGINAWSATGEIKVANTGVVTAELAGISAANLGGGAVTINQEGNVTSYSNTGISAWSSTGAITVTVTGNSQITAEHDGITAGNKGDTTVAVTSSGTITANQGSGILASSTTGEVEVKGSGDIFAAVDGIVASNVGETNVSITRTSGNITATTGRGIIASSAVGAVVVHNTGHILAEQDGIVASNLGTTAVKVTQDGDVTSRSGYGIIATSALGAITVVSTGDIVAKEDGISAGNVSDTGLVSIQHTGDITTTNGSGIFVKSANAAIDVTTDGDIQAGGDGVRLSGYGNQSVTVTAGSVKGGAGFAGINFDGGHINSLANGGTISTADGIAGDAVTAGADSVTSIINTGTITGNVLLSEWANSFTNNELAVFNTGAFVNLGEGTLTNSGFVSIGGDGVVATTALTGSFVNTSTGTLKIDIDLANSTADRLDVSENASFAGNLGLNLTSIGAFGQTFTVASANSVTVSNLALSNPLVNYAINTPDDEHLDITVAGYDYITQGMNPNGRAIGGYLNNAIGNTPSLDPIGLALLNLGSLEEVNDAYNQLSPDTYLNQQLTALYDSLGFASSLLSCKVRDGAFAFNAEGECAWGRVGYRTFDRDTTADMTGFSRDTWELAGGAQYAFKDDYRFGFGAAAGTSKSTGADGATSDGKQIEAGVVVKYVPGPLTLSAAASGSYAWYDTERSVNFGDFSDDLTGKPESGTLNARLRASYDFGNETVYIRPQIEGNATYLYQAAFSETGGLAAVSVDSGSRTVFSVAPELEVGGQVVTAGGTMIRPYVKGGVTVFSNDGFDLNARFTADTSGTDAFTITTSTDRLLWNTSAGVDVLFENGNTIRAFYDGNFGQTSTENAFGLKASHNF
ncbi:autotransporter domain-containing protein [Kaistia terrae]|uniref:Autotransporter domain-containing protein n=1 Tax=Kaistia terrae TaxID=537017 RepID=A0ABW0Q3X9_9HYPH|nr:autotransporter domain-containing protein [Kaistia terrae]MCX5581129.1 autotransporter domain-containing protein [Kaistia terrae]